MCGHVETVDVDRGRIAEPTLCQRCQTNHCLALIHNRSLFDDKQIVKVQVGWNLLVNIFKNYAIVKT